MSTLDEKLARYLEDREVEKAKGVSLERVYEVQVRLADSLTNHMTEDAKRFKEGDDHRASMDKRIVAAEANIENLQDGAETTGEHAVDAIREAAEAKGMAVGKASAAASRSMQHTPWWRRALDTTVAKVTVAAAALALGWLIRHLSGHP